MLVEMFLIFAQQVTVKQIEWDSDSHIMKKYFTSNEKNLISLSSSQEKCCRNGYTSVESSVLATNHISFKKNIETKAFRAALAVMTHLLGKLCILQSWQDSWIQGSAGWFGYDNPERPFLAACSYAMQGIKWCAAQQRPGSPEVQLSRKRREAASPSEAFTSRARNE